MAHFRSGEVAERSKAAVLKTADPQGSGGSNPSLSATACGAAGGGFSYFPGPGEVAERLKALPC